MDINPTILEEIFAQTIGRDVLQYCNDQRVLEKAAQNVESVALSVLAQIKTILDDNTLDDPECFQRIEAIINALHAQGVSTSRHDWG